jgi:hypothetical protein
MALPKKEKNYLPLIPTKVGVERRQEMLDDITNDGTFLPKGVLHADLDKGILDFVKDDIKLTVDGKVVPTVNKIITTQSWYLYFGLLLVAALARGILVKGIPPTTGPAILGVKGRSPSTWGVIRACSATTWTGI